MTNIYKEAFGRLGYDCQLVTRPGERALVDADLGTVDGEAALIAAIDPQAYPNLIRVPCPIATIKDGAYATDPSIKIDGWESLKGHTYKVGLLKGIKSIETKLPLYINRENIVTLSDAEQSLKMLKAKRIDLFIVSTQIEESAFMKSGAYDEIKCVGIVEAKALYPWLHKRHRHLVQPLADMLKSMRSEGRLD